MLLSLNLGEFLLKALDLFLLNLTLPQHVRARHEVIRRHQLRHLSDASVDIDSLVSQALEFCIQIGDTIVGRLKLWRGWWKFLVRRRQD